MMSTAAALARDKGRVWWVAVVQGSVCAKRERARGGLGRRRQVVLWRAHGNVLDALGMHSARVFRRG
jgi:hypothetical protein